MSETTTDELVHSIIDQNYTAATEIFNDMIGQKMQSALDQEKIAIADQIFNGFNAEGGPEDDDYVVADPDVEDEEFDDEEFDDEDIDVDEEEWDDDPLEGDFEEE